MASLAREPSINELFFIERVNGDTICIRSSNGLLWSLKNDYENAITSSDTLLSTTTKFTIKYIADNDNRIAIKAANQKYISIGANWPFIITANATELEKNELFRYFLVEK